VLQKKFLSLKILKTTRGKNDAVKQRPSYKFVWGSGKGRPIDGHLMQSREGLERPPKRWHI
jgi:hypothetical protein